VKQDSIRTTVNIQETFHQRPRPQKVRFPLIVSKGPKVNVTNKRIYEHVEFP